MFIQVATGGDESQFDMSIDDVIKDVQKQMNYAAVLYANKYSIDNIKLGDFEYWQKVKANLRLLSLYQVMNAGGDTKYRWCGYQTYAATKLSDIKDLGSAFEPDPDLPKFWRGFDINNSIVMVFDYSTSVTFRNADWFTGIQFSMFDDMKIEIDSINTKLPLFYMPAGFMPKFNDWVSSSTRVVITEGAEMDFFSLYLGLAESSLEPFKANLSITVPDGMSQQKLVRRNWRGPWRERNHWDWFLEHSTFNIGFQYYIPDVVQDSNKSGPDPEEGDDPVLELPEASADSGSELKVEVLVTNAHSYWINDGNQSGEYSAGDAISLSRPINSDGSNSQFRDRWTLYVGKTYTGHQLHLLNIYPNDIGSATKKDGGWPEGYVYKLVGNDWIKRQTKEGSFYSQYGPFMFEAVPITNE